MATIQHIVHTFGLSEPEIAERIAEFLMKENPTVDTKPYKGGVSIIVTGNGFNNEDAETICKPVVDTLCECLGTYVCGVDITLQEHVVKLLKQKHLKIALAESCTAGKLSEQLTEVPGVSEVFECGIISYSHDIKHSLLGVSDDLLKEKGAVCAEVATAMATGVRLIGDASFGVSITGVAGPDPSDGQPVGTVYLALADSRRVWVRKLEETNKSREEIRESATFAALDLVRRYLEALPGIMAGSQSIEKHGPEKIITPAVVKKKTLADYILLSRANGKADFIRRLAILLFIIILIVGSCIAGYVYLYKPFQNEQIYEDLEEAYNAPIPPEKTIDISQYPDGMLEQFYSLYDKNSDINGWISIDGTNVSYPVMNSLQSDFYAKHDFNKKDSDFGVPYFSSVTNLTDKNAINSVLTIFGNYTDANQMFSSVAHYLDKEFFLKHQFLSMNTLYKTSRWQVCGVMVVDSANNNAEFDYTRNTFETKEDHQLYLDELQDRSLFMFTNKISINDNLLLLSVDYAEQDDFKTERIVVIAKQLNADDEEKSVKKIENNNDVVYPFAFSGIPYTKRSVIFTTTSKMKSTTTTTTREENAHSSAEEQVRRTTSHITQAPVAKPTSKQVTTKATTKETTKVTTKATTIKTTVATTQPTETTTTSEPEIVSDTSDS